MLVRFDTLVIGDHFYGHNRLTGELDLHIEYRVKQEGGYRDGVRIRDEQGKIAGIGNSFNETQGFTTFFKPEELVLVKA